MRGNVARRGIVEDMEEDITIADSNQGYMDRETVDLLVGK